MASANAGVSSANGAGVGVLGSLGAGESAGRSGKRDREPAAAACLREEVIDLTADDGPAASADGPGTPAGAAPSAKRLLLRAAAAHPAPTRKPPREELLRDPDASVLQGRLVTVAPLAQSRQPGPRSLPPAPAGLLLLRGFVGPEEQVSLAGELDRLRAASPMRLGTFQLYGKQVFYNAYLTSSGRHWDAPGRRYVGGSGVPAVPERFHALLARVASDPRVVASGLPLRRRADIAVGNYYPPGWGSMGQHQDKAEPRAAVAAGWPVVSVSLGDSADFFVDVPAAMPRGRALAPDAPGPDDLPPGSLAGRGDECRGLSPPGGLERLRFRLDSGDVLLFGGPVRLVRHGVERIHAGVRPRGLRLARGRINLQLRCIAEE